MCGFNKQGSHSSWNKKFTDFSSTFKDLPCFQALSRALNFKNRIQPLSRIFQALYERWINLLLYNVCPDTDRSRRKCADFINRQSMSNEKVLSGVHTPSVNIDNGYWSSSTLDSWQLHIAYDQHHIENTKRTSFGHFEYDQPYKGSCHNSSP